ncbi:MAG: methyltransferase [Magnetospirillum sp.]|nr:methyltransferase [Magnetospirillum sp.]
MHDVSHALVLPFDRDLLPFPGRAFLMRAEPAEAFTAEWKAVLTCEQSFKPAFDALAAAGFTAVPRLECDDNSLARPRAGLLSESPSNLLIRGGLSLQVGSQGDSTCKHPALAGRFPAGLLLLTKHKAENRANLVRAWSLLEPGGLLVACGANAIGAASFEREVDKAVVLEGHLSKHQARTFWLRRQGEEMPPALVDWQKAARPAPVGDTGLVARAGCFSPDHADTGSRVLADCFPDGVMGRVADLGAGWGYLGARLLHRFAAITELDSYEAEALALEDARANLDAIDHGAARSYHWQDVAAGLPEVAPYDWIVSNPPFHEGARADPAIGRAFIAAAWKAIRRRGKVLLVANQHLPYEAELRKRFRDVELLRVAEGFKVYQASNRVDHVR